MSTDRREDYERKMWRYRFYDSWLTNRLKLFKTFTHPSVLAQTDQDFRWVNIVHPRSPKWFLDELSKLDKVEIKPAVWDIEAAIRGVDSVNLDTDDAISKDFIESAKAVDFGGEITFSHGIKYRVFTDFWAGYTWDIAPFNIIKHPETTILDFLHGRSDLRKHTIFTEEPKWVQIIHEKNIANALRLPRSKRSNPQKGLDLDHVLQFFEIDSKAISPTLIMGVESC
jgi:hypothetical protein